MTSATPVVVHTARDGSAAGLDRSPARSGLARQASSPPVGPRPDYRGEIMITLYSTSPEITHVVEDGDRIAQLVVVRLAEIQFELAGELSGTARGAGGHGSTGR